MVEVAARWRRRTILLEEGDALMTGMHEYLSVRIAVNRHTENFGVEFLGFLRIVDVQHDVVDATGRYHRFLPSRLRITFQLLIFAQSPSGATTTGLPRTNSLGSTRAAQSSAITLSRVSLAAQLGRCPLSFLV